MTVEIGVPPPGHHWRDTHCPPPPLLHCPHLQGQGELYYHIFPPVNCSPLGLVSVATGIQSVSNAVHVSTDYALQTRVLCALTIYTYGQVNHCSQLAIPHSHPTHPIFHTHYTTPPTPHTSPYNSHPTSHIPQLTPPVHHEHQS